MIILDPVVVTDDVLISTNVPAENPQFDLAAVYGPGDRVNSDATNAHFVYQQLKGDRSTVTLTLGSPGTVNWPAHGKANGQAVKLTTTGALPSGAVAGTTYYVVNAGGGTLQLAATPGGSAISFAGSQSGTHTITANDIGKAVTDENYWVKVSATNARMMFDEINSTLTENPEVIEVRLKPRTLYGGVYLGGVYGDEVEIQMVDDRYGVVYQSKHTLIQSTSRSSYYRWTFNRIRRKNFLLALDLPRFWGATVFIKIKKPGGIAKCGLCAVGPLTEIGLSLYGMGIEDKDYSSTRFDVDGTSETTKRGYSKILTLDVQVDNEEIHVITDILRDFRQRNVVYIGAVQYGHSVVVGKYESLKSVMPNIAFSTMAMKINGVI
nr:hypothetical protein [uncultured Duganella sp.]